MSADGEKAAVFRTTKVRTKLKGDSSWLQQSSGSQTETRDEKVKTKLKGDSSWLQQRNDPQAAAAEEEKPWMAELRSCRQNGESALSSPVSSPTKSTQPLTKSEAERKPASGFLIRGVFTKLDSTSSSPSNSSSGSTQIIKKPSESYKKIAPHTVKSSVGNQETQLSEEEQQKRTEAASNVLKQSAVRQRSYVLSAARKFESQQDASEPPLDQNHQSFVATRVEIIDDESAGAATPVASTAQTKPRRIVNPAVVDQEEAAPKEETPPEPVKEEDPFENLKPGCTKVDTPLPELGLEGVQSAGAGTKAEDSPLPGQTEEAVVDLTPVAPAPVTPAAAPPTAASEPVSTAPVSTAPVSTAPVSTAPVSTAPVSTAPVSTTPQPPTASSPVPKPAPPERAAPAAVTPQSPLPLSVNTESPVPPSPVPESLTPVSTTPDAQIPTSPVPRAVALVSITQDSPDSTAPVPGSTTLVSTIPESPTPASPVPGSTTLVSITPKSPTAASPVPGSTTLVSITPESPTATSPVPGSTTLVSITPEPPTAASPVPGSTTLVSITPKSPTATSPVPGSTTVVSITPKSPTAASPVPGSTTLVSITPKSPTATSPVPGSTTLVSITPEPPTAASPVPGSTTLVSITPEPPDSTSPVPGSTTLVSITPESPAAASPVPGSTTLVSITQESPTAASPVPGSITLVSITQESPTATSPVPGSTTLVSITPDSPDSTSPVPGSITLVSITPESPTATTESQAAVSFVPVPSVSAETEITERTELEPSLILSSRDDTLVALSDTLISFDTSSSRFKNDEPALVEGKASPAEERAHREGAEETPTSELSNSASVTEDLLAFASGPEEPPEPVPSSPGRWSQELLSDLGGDPGEASSTVDLLASDVIFITREAPGLNVEPEGEKQAADGSQRSTETVTTTTKTVIVIDKGERMDPETWSSNVKTTVVETSLADPFDPYPIGTTAPTSSVDPLQPDSDISINSVSTTYTETKDPGTNTSRTAMAALADDIIPINTDTSRISTRRSWARTWETDTTEQSPDAGAEDGDQKMFVMFERKSSENDSPWDRWTSPTVYTITMAEEEEGEEEERPEDTQTETVTTITTIREIRSEPEPATEHYGTYSRTLIEEDQRVQTPPPEAKKPFVFVKEYINTTASSLQNMSTDGPYSSSTTFSSGSGSSTCTYCGELVGNDTKITIEHLNVNSHPHCFKCAVCGKQMGDLLDNMFIHGGKVNCETCYSRALD